jgi:hypothetical protein
MLNPDLKFGPGAPVPDLARDSGYAGLSYLKNQGTSTNIPGRDDLIHLNQRYLDVLNTAQAVDLLDTIIHEALHHTRPPELQVLPSYDHPYIVPEAAKRTAADRKQFLQERKSCGCKAATP